MGDDPLSDRDGSATARVSGPGLCPILAACFAPPNPPWTAIRDRRIRVGPQKPWSEGMWWAREELNLRPLPCQRALASRMTCNPGRRELLSWGVVGPPVSAVVRDLRVECGPDVAPLRAREGQGRRERTWLRCGGDGHKLNRRVRPVHHDHLPRWQASGGGAADRSNSNKGTMRRVG
jgi:hypothetical protein